MKRQVFRLLTLILLFLGTGNFTVFSWPPPRKKGLLPFKPRKAYFRKVDLRRLTPLPPGKLGKFKGKKLVFPRFIPRRSLKPKTEFDPVLQKKPGRVLAPVPILTFEGLDLTNWGAGWPPDVNGDVGRSNVGAENRGYYIQAVNTSFGIFDKATGTLVAATTFDDFFDGTGTPCDDSNMGDPIVLYDRYLDRWLITDYAFSDVSTPPHYQCIAMSASNDPVSGGWYIWALNFENNDGVSSSSNVLNSYPKVGVWEDGYYFTFNDFDMDNGGDYLGVTIWALDKNAMASGTLSGMLGFLDYSSHPYAWSLLPANAKSPTPPPSGEPEFLITIGDDAWGGISSDSIAIYLLDVDFDNMTSSISGPTVVEVASFDSDMCGYSENCIPQPGTLNKLDALSSRLMHSAFYWNYGTHESIFLNHTVDAGGDHAGIRWYELRDPAGSPYIYQQGTYAPDSRHRWMASIAANSSADVAIGFSISSSNQYPSIYYAGRKSTDPLGTLGQGETALQQGQGSQWNTGRWGDYTMLTVDPDDDQTFWYTNEYYAVNGTDWNTKIGAFRFSVEGDNPPSVTITEPSDGDSVSGNVSISADASDDLGVVRVEFYVDGVLKYSDSSSPYGFTWDSTEVADGSHEILAIAYDTSNQTATHSITVSTNNGSLPMLVIDLDGNKNSCTAIRDELINQGYDVQYLTSMPSSINPSTPIVWVCLGVYPNNHVLTSSEGDVLSSYLDGGGRLYMEGGDTWCYDSSTSVHPYFGTWLRGDYNCYDGSGDLSQINGISGTFTEGISWIYSGDNNWMDHIGANQSDSFNIWDNSSPLYHTGVARETSNYKTIAASHEFGGASTSDRNIIMEKYLEFFLSGGGVPGAPTVTFLYPTDGAPVFSVIWVRVRAQDDEGIDRVEFFLDGVLQYIYNCGGSLTCDARWHWDTTTATVGQHTLKAIAYDITSTTGSQTITVDVHPGYGQHYGGTGDDIGRDIAMDSNGDLLMVGESNSISWRGMDFLLYRINPNGTKEWHQNYGTYTYDEYAEAIAVDSSGNMYIAGYMFDGTQKDILVKKIAPDGAELWSKRLGGSGDEVAYDVALTSGEDPIIAGYTTSYTYGGSDAVIYKLSQADGSVIFGKHYGGSDDDTAYGLVIDDSDNIYLIGSSRSFTGGDEDIALWKLDQNGSKIYGMLFGGDQDEAGSSGILYGGNLYIVGTSTSYTYGGNDIVVYKLDPDTGLKIKGAHFGGGADDGGRAIAVNADGKIIIVGYSESYTNGGMDAVAYSLTTELIKHWGRNLGASGQEQAQAVVTDAEGHIYVFGFTNSFTYGGYDFLLYKLSQEGLKLPVGSGNGY